MMIKQVDAVALAMELGLPCPINVSFVTQELPELKSQIRKDLQEQEDPEESLQKEKENIDEVAEAVSYTSEDVHGGNEATGDIEDSPSVKEDGIQERGEIHGSNTQSGRGQKPLGGSRNRTEFLMKAEESMYYCDAPDPMIYEKIVEIAEKEQSRSFTSGAGRTDKKGIVRFLCEERTWKIPEAKMCRKSADSVNLFIDFSGSFAYRIRDVRIAIDKLQKAGYEVTVYDVANGLSWKNRRGPCSGNFVDESLRTGEMDDYNSSARLQAFAKKVGANTDADICKPGLKDAVELCKNAQFTVIIADYDGFKDFSTLSFALPKDKVPYFLDFDSRYSDPSQHDWVGYENSFYSCPEKLFKMVEVECLDDYYF